MTVSRTKACAPQGGRFVILGESPSAILIAAVLAVAPEGCQFAGAANMVAFIERKWRGHTIGRLGPLAGFGRREEGSRTCVSVKEWGDSHMRTWMPRPARRWAAQLAADGVRPGDRVATTLAGVDFAPAAHTLPKIGAVLVPVNTRLTEYRARGRAGRRETRAESSTDPEPRRRGDNHLPPPPPPHPPPPPPPPPPRPPRRGKTSLVAEADPASPSAMISPPGDDRAAQACRKLTYGKPHAERPGPAARTSGWDPMTLAVLHAALPHVGGMSIPHAVPQSTAPRPWIHEGFDVQECCTFLLWLEGRGSRDI